MKTAQFKQYFLTDGVRDFQNKAVNFGCNKKLLKVSKLYDDFIQENKFSGKKKKRK